MYYSPTPISLAEAAKIVPALAAQKEHYSRSDQYEYIPTIAVLAALQQQGFHIHGLQEAKTKDEFRSGFQKHLIRLRKQSDRTKVGDVVPEIVIINSHDGSCAYQLVGGVFVLVCENGCIVGEQWGSLKVPHRGGRTISDVIEGSFKIVKTFDAVMGNVEHLKQIVLSADEQEDYAEKAMNLRFKDVDKAPVTPLALLQHRRSADQGDTLWKTYNRVQENIIRGGLKGRRTDSNGRLRGSYLRAVKGINGNLALNRALWTLTEEAAASKGYKLLPPPTKLAA